MSINGTDRHRVEIRSLAERAIVQLGRAIEYAKCFSALIEKEHAEQQSSLRRRFQEARAQLLTGFGNSLKKELAKLNPYKTATQEEWTSPNIRFWVAGNSSGCFPYAIRIGSRPIGLLTEEILVPVFLELVATRNLLIIANTQGGSSADVVLNAVICRHLVTLPPGECFLRFADLSKFGASLSHYVQELPSEITDGQIAHNQGSLDSLFTFLENRIAEVHRTVINPQTPTIAHYESSELNGFAPQYFIVVLDNFPVGLDARRLETLRRIIENGPKAGVSVVARADKQADLPDWISTTTSKHLVVLTCGQEGCTVSDDAVTMDKLVVDTLPSTDYELNLLRLVRREYETRHAGPVAPEMRSVADWWKGDCSQALSIVLGTRPSGGTARLTFNEQTLVGGIVLGSPGSGKSNLLHVVISKLVEAYPPEALNIYAIDLKGVEFNSYAVSGVPHFKLIASNMGAEIGLEALREIDRMMKDRQTQFATAGVNRLSQYIEKSGSTLPRIVLIIDEFHRLFEGSHTAAQEAERLLMNLLKQGRSFGIHVLLATQSLLAGKVNAQQVKSLVPIRVALTCHDPREYRELFGHAFIVPPELAKLGYATMTESATGSELGIVFRCPFMTDDERQRFLDIYRAFSDDRGYGATTAVLLDGVARADIRKNETLGELATYKASLRTRTHECRVWIGDTFSMAKRAEVVFRRQNRSNLLLVMQDRFSAECEALCCAALVAAVGGSMPGSRCYVSIPSAASPDDLASIRLLSQALPSCIQLINEVASADLVNQLMAIVTRRRGGSDDAETYFWIIPQLHRCNELRLGLKAEPSAKKNSMIETLLQEGPRVGVHTIVWSDSTSLIDYPLRPHFSLRISSRVDKDDSKALFNLSDVAAELPDDLGFFWDTESGNSPAIFRPYSEIPADWRTAWVKQFCESREGTV